MLRRNALFSTCKYVPNEKKHLQGWVHSRLNRKDWYTGYWPPKQKTKQRLVNSEAEPCHGAQNSWSTTRPGEKPGFETKRP